METVKDTILTPQGYQQITDLSAVVGLQVPDTYRYALLQAVSSDIRWRDDGVDPTASIGIILSATKESFFFYNGNLNTIKFIQVSGGAELNIAYYS